ncbi:MAG: hypothetical protein ACKO96_00915, partial [Flammeovirgaceae bacterium]
FLETKLSAATSSLIYFDSNARINSASLSSITVGTASYFNGNSVSSSFSTTASYALTASLANNSLTASNVATTSNVFIQGGNSFGTLALLGTNDNQSLAFETSGSERMRITNAGNVGIGTTNP